MKHKLFVWEENNICYKNQNPDKTYNNVLLNTGTVVKGQFENQICTTKIDEEIKIISDSNHYIHGHKWGDGYNALYKIFDNIIRNFQQNIDINQSINTDFENVKCFYYINSFMFSNSGHDLSCMLNYVDYINKNNIKNIVTLKNYKNTNNFKLLIHLLPTDINIIELSHETVYFFKEIIIIDQVVYNILCHNYLICNLKNIINEKYSNQYSDYKNKNIILMKTNRSPNVMLQSTVLQCESLLVKLENMGYIYVVPENMDIIYLALLLMNANNIVFSTGSILYTNKIFFNENAKLYFINGYRNFDANCHGLSRKNFTHINAFMNDDEIIKIIE